MKLFTLILFLFSGGVFAGDIYYGTQTETLIVGYGGPTLIKFDKQVRTISRAGRFKISVANPSDPDYSVLSVEPRYASGSSRVAFILEDGRSVRLKFKIVKGRDNIASDYNLKPKASLIAKPGSKNLPVVTEIDLLKAMIRDDSVIGYKRQVLKKNIKSGKNGISVSLLRRYIGENYVGYVFIIRNHLKKHQLKIDPRSLRIGKPNLAVVSQVDEMVLDPKKKKTPTTILRVVAKPSARNQSVLLPIGTKNLEGDGQ